VSGVKSLGILEFVNDCWDSVGALRAEVLVPKVGYLE